MQNKIVELKLWGCEVINTVEKNNRKIRTGVIFWGGWFTLISLRKMRITRMFFSTIGFRTDKNISFDWKDVKKITIIDNNKNISILGEKDNDIFL